MRHRTAGLPGILPRQASDRRVAKGRLRKEPPRPSQVPLSRLHERRPDHADTEPEARQGPVGPKVAICPEIDSYRSPTLAVHSFPAFSYCLQLSNDWTAKTCARRGKITANDPFSP